MKTVNKYSAWFILATAVIAMILLPAALTGTTIAFPEIEQYFSSNRATLSWILSGYSITTAAFTLLGGQLSDRLGATAMFVRGIFLFLVGAVACTFAPNVGILIMGRTLQGIGAAIFAPASLAMVLGVFPHSKHALTIGIWAAAVPIGSALSPTIASFILEIADWRWMFAIQGLGAILVIAAILPLGQIVRVQKSFENKSVDYWGIPIGSASIGFLALGIVQGPRWGWTSWETILAFAASVLLFPLFIYRNKDQVIPLVDFKLFSIPTFTTANIVSLGVSLVGSSVWLLWPIHLASVWEYSQIQIGLAITPTPLLAGIVSIGTGWWVQTYGYRGTLLIGTAILALANTWFILFYGSDVHYWGRMFPGLVLYGLAMGLTFAPLNSAALADVPENVYGRANATFLTGRAICSAIGIAILVAIIGDSTGIEALPAFRKAFIFLSGLSTVSFCVVASIWPKTHKPQTLIEN